MINPHSRSKWACQDRKPLVALAPVDAALEAAADKLCETLEKEAKNGDDVMKAGALH